MSNLGVHELLALLDRLKATAQDFAAQEDKLAAEARAKSAAETKAFAVTGAKIAAGLSAGLADAEAVYRTAQNKCQAKFERRNDAIRQAHRASRKQALEKIQEEEGRCKYQIQKNMLEAERRRETELASQAARADEFNWQLGESRQTLGLLETAAQKAFRGYGRFRRLLSPTPALPEPEPVRDEQQLLEAIRTLHGQTQEALERFHKFRLPGLFRCLSLWLLIVLLLLASAALVPLLDYFEVTEFSYREAGVSLGALLTLVFTVHYGGYRHAKPAAHAIAAHLAQARSLDEACRVKAATHQQQELDRINLEFESAKRTLDDQWRSAVRMAAESSERRPQQIDVKALRLSQRNEQLHQSRLAQIEQQHTDTVARCQQEAAAQQQQLVTAHETKLSRLTADQQTRWQTLEAKWTSGIQPIADALHAADAAAAALFPAWQLPGWDAWSPPPEFKNAAQFGRLEVDVEQFTGVTRENRCLVWPGPATLAVPLLLTYPCQGSLLFETTTTGHETVVATINNLIFRLLSTTPPGKLSLTIIDPVGLGQSFAGLMHLADYAESYINGRIWTQTQQIEEKLAELNEHMEKVIQMYLRNEYATIAEYNAQAGTLAEKYHLLVIAGFPVNFSETAARRLLNIAASGARCGVYTLIHWDHRQALPHDFIPDALRKNQVRIVGSDAGFTLADWQRPGTRLVFDAPPAPDFALRFLNQVGESSRTAVRVEVPFALVAPPAPEVWTLDLHEELRVPIGRMGATKLQYLAIGKGTRQHALIAGKTGSGKSTLFHVIITNLSLWCSPEQVVFYLVDFKKGVEFKCYATRRLPHARVVAVESDREFGLSVLQRVDEELQRRGDLFRKRGVPDLAGFIKAGGAEPVPRCLLIIDEFQEFFVEEDRISQNAAVLLDRIVRQGRAFGIHVLLGSQTLGGAYTLARATLGQMVIRIAFQCNEADAYLIMDEANAAPRLLSRPGEGIYNDAAGALENNSPFQAAWLPDEQRDEFLASLRERADRRRGAYPGPMVFEGRAPADVQENAVLNAALETQPVHPPLSARLWLGAPNSVKGPTEAVFSRQSGNHLLIVGQYEEAALAILSVALVSLAAQYPPRTVRFILLDSTPPGSRPREFLDRVIQAIPHPVLRPKPGDLAEVLNGLATELSAQAGEDSASNPPVTFLLIHGLENYKKLQQEDEFSFSASDRPAGPNPAALLVQLLEEGPTRGLHVIATCDTHHNVIRFLGRKALAQIAMRVLFQMSANDSASLIEAPDASALGLHRALYYHDQEGYLERFRPYRLPGNDWLETVARSLARPGAAPA